MPKYLTKEELKETQLDILKYIDRICKEMIFAILSVMEHY